MATVFTLQPSVKFYFEAGVCSGSSTSVYVETSYQLDLVLTVEPVRVLTKEITIGGRLPWEKTFEILAPRLFAAAGSQGCVPNSQAVASRRRLQEGSTLTPGSPVPADAAFDSDTPSYSVSPWSACDSACGPGNRTRSVQCVLTPSGVPVSTAECIAVGLGSQPDTVEACEVLPSSACFGLEPEPGPVLLAMGDHATVVVTASDVSRWTGSSFGDWYSYKLVGFVMPNNTRSTLEVKLMGNAGGNLEAWYQCTGCSDGVCEGACTTASRPDSWVMVRSVLPRPHRRLVVAAGTYPPGGQLLVYIGSQAARVGTMRVSVTPFRMLASSVTTSFSLTPTSTPLRFMFQPKSTAGVVGMYVYLLRSGAASLAGPAPSRGPGVFVAAVPVGANVECESPLRRCCRLRLHVRAPCALMCVSAPWPMQR